MSIRENIYGVSTEGRERPQPNNRMQVTAYSVCSCLAPASSRT